MPLYEYECDACRHRFEIIQKFSDPPPDACPRCGRGPLRRLLSSPAIQFKGSGWYITDYAQKGKSEGKSDQKGEAASSDTKTNTAKTDTAKTDTAKSDSGAKTETTKTDKSGTTTKSS